MLVNLKKTEFAPAGVQAGSSSRTFHLEATDAGGKVQSKKLYWLKRKLLHLQLCFIKVTVTPLVVGVLGTRPQRIWKSSLIN